MVTKGHGEHRRQLKGAIDGGNIWWIAPSYGVASDIWRDLKRACRNAWTDKWEVERRIQLPGGGSVTVKSADNPDTLRGSGLDGVVLDEAASIKQSVWHQAIRPALSDRQGWGVFIGTPKGFNWFHDLFQFAGEASEWERFQRPSHDNPLMLESELEQAKAEIGGYAFSQEYLAQFVADGLGMFKRDWLLGEHGERVVDSVPLEAKRAVRAWDKAGTEGGGDYSAGVLIAEHDGIFYICDVLRGQWSSHQRNRIVEHAAVLDDEQFDKLDIWTEQEPGSGGKESAEFTARQLVGYSVHAERVTGDKPTRAAPFAAQCEAGNVRLVRGAWNRAFIDELSSFPNGSHDDQVDAAALAFNKLAKPKRIFAAGIA